MEQPLGCELTLVGLGSKKGGPALKSANPMRLVLGVLKTVCLFWAPMVLNAPAEWESPVERVIQAERGGSLDRTQEDMVQKVAD